MKIAIRKLNKSYKMGAINRAEWIHGAVGLIVHRNKENGQMGVLLRSYHLAWLEAFYLIEEIHQEYQLKEIVGNRECKIVNPGVN